MIHCRILACTQMRRKAHNFVSTIQRCSRPVSTHSLSKICSIHQIWTSHSDSPFELSLQRKNWERWVYGKCRPCKSAVHFFFYFDKSQKEVREIWKEIWKEIWEKNSGNFERKFRFFQKKTGTRKFWTQFANIEVSVRTEGVHLWLYN